MRSMLHTFIAELFHLHPFFQDLLVLSGVIIDSLANCALQLDHIILGHILL